MRRFIFICVAMIGSNAMVKAQGSVIAEEIRSYINAPSSDEKIAVTTPKGETHYVRSAATTTTHHIGGHNTSNNTVVFDAFNAHPEWQDMNVVVDWTGSMYSYVGQVVRWHHVNKDKQLIHSMVLFNDGDDRLRQGGRKVIGSTGGIYFPNHTDLDDFLKTVALAVDNGGGGDGPENDVEAIIAAQSNDPTGRPFVLIADSSGIRDISLLTQIERPVHVIMCNNPTSDYVRLAQYTKGSLTWPGGYTDYSITCAEPCVNVSHHNIDCGKSY